jgi:long-chain acyl-CoA synthetase
VITVNPVNSANRFIKFLAKLSSLFKKKNSEKSSANDWNNFVNSNNSNSEIDEFPYKPDYNAVIVHTGGTTGIPKGVVLSNDNFNNATLQIKNSNVKSGRNYRFLNIMPPFIAYGIVLGINAPITLGWHTIVIPKFDPNNFFDLLKKYKPNGIMGVPTYFENLMKDKKAQKADFSYIKNVLLGGDFTHEEFKKRLINFWRQHNSNGEVNVGYSLTEASACATFSSSKADAENSVGIPLTKTTIGVFEKDTTFEVPVNNNGEICIKTPTHMLGYYERSEETNKVLIKHDDGYYIHTGDSGYINGDGIVFVNGRYKRIIPRSGFKVFPSQIENVISEHPGVESCAVIGIPDSIDITVPKAIIVLKPSYIGQEEKVIDELNNRILKSILPPYFLPAEYEFVKELPLTNIGKVDFIKLQDDEKQNHLSLVKK